MDVLDRTPRGYKGKPRMRKPCKVCGNEFEIAPGLAEKYTTCSDKCRSEGYRKPIPSTKRCTGPCGRTLDISHFYMTGRGKPMPRCKDCQGDAQRDRIAKLKQERLAAPPGPIPDRTHLTWPGKKRIQQACTVCGGPYLIAPSLAHRYQTDKDECEELRRRRDRERTPATAVSRVCPGCRRELPRQNFVVVAIKKRLYLSNLCVECLAQPEVVKRHGGSREATNNWRRRQVMGMTMEEWTALLPTLRSDYAICGTTDDLCF